MVKVNDQIVEVDGRSLHGYTNQEAVEMLRSTGNIVRYHRHTQSSSR
jgi:multiple PDZ domain protein